jgi:hypothetical protein
MNFFFFPYHSRKSGNVIRIKLPIVVYFQVNISCQHKMSISLTCPFLIKNYYSLIPKCVTVEILLNQHLFQEEIVRSSNSGNDCYHSVTKLLSSSPLSRNVKIKI